jgi:hypothetical protein
VGRDSVEPSDKTQSAPRSVALPPEEGKDQTQHDANNDAGDDWEIECAVAAFDADIARQTSEPAGANSAPKEKAKNDDHDSEDDEKFSELGHAAKLVDYTVMSSEVETPRGGYPLGSLDFRSG